MKKKGNKDAIIKILEGFINIIILISIIQILFEDIAQLKGLNDKIKIYLIFIGLIIDIIFSVEFVIRSILSLRAQGFINYFFYNYGWIDFICSFPLLLLNSLPSFLLFLAAQRFSKGLLGIIRIIRIVRIIRITRILRILRVLKLIKNLQNANSKMAQNHLSQIMVIFIFSVLTSLIIFSFIPGLSSDKLIENKINTYKLAFSSYNNVIKDYLKGFKYDEIYGFLQSLKNSFVLDKDLLSVELNDISAEVEIENPIIYKIENFDYILGNFQTQVLNLGLFKITFSLKSYKNFKIIIELFFLVIIILGSLLFVFIYLSTFVKRISDIIYIIYKGIRYKDYYLMVKIPEKYKDEEIFEFAKFYNDIYLPAKKKLYHKREKSSKLSIDDLLNLDL